SIILLLFPLFVVFIQESNSSSNTFTQCLTSNSEPKHPISAVVLFAGNRSYSSVLEANIRNLRFNTSNTPKPFLIIATTHESHVQAAVTCGKRNNLQMKNKKRWPRLRWLVVYYNIWEKSKTLAYPGGICPTVGVGGHFSGGGYSNMLRKYGLTVDNTIDEWSMSMV
ncbi:hypothetical protein CARUB_v10006343mg, partial [Capsella rubella]